MSVPKILCVDDETNILDAFQRQLRHQFNLDTANSGNAALQMIANRGPYSVVVSDMRMPEMDGVEFLHRVKELAPDSVRLMLTGNADQECAIRAVNEGNIFRFLTKPCSHGDLSRALLAAVEQHRLIVAEKELLQKTLSGSVKLLTDILSFVAPASFGNAVKLRHLIQKVAPDLGLSAWWDIELGGMLSNLGDVTVPAVVMAKYEKGVRLSPAEQELIDKMPAIGQSLIANIPRLAGVADIVLFQNKHYDGTGFPFDNVQGESIPVGARIIKILKDLLQLETQGNTTEHALNIMRDRQGWYDRTILASIKKHLTKPQSTSAPIMETKILEVKPHQLSLGQVLFSNVETQDGVLLISAGSTITEMLLERITNYSRFVGLKEPIRVECIIATKQRGHHNEATSVIS